MPIRASSHAGSPLREPISERRITASVAYAVPMAATITGYGLRAA